MKNCHRESTNSITHLVKIVAEEVAEEVYERHLDEAKEHMTAIAEAVIAEKQQEFDLPPNIVNPFGESKCMSTWHGSEDTQLQREVTAFLQQVAKRHGRTERAIKCRLSDNVKHFFS